MAKDESTADTIDPKARPEPETPVPTSNSDVALAISAMGEAVIRLADIALKQDERLQEDSGILKGMHKEVTVSFRDLQQKYEDLASAVRENTKATREHTTKVSHFITLVSEVLERDRGRERRVKVLEDRADVIDGAVLAVRASIDALKLHTRYAGSDGAGGANRSPLG